MLKWTALRFALLAAGGATLGFGCICSAAYLLQSRSDEAIDRRQQELMHQVLQDRDGDQYQKATRANYDKRKDVDRLLPGTEQRD